MSRTQHPIDLIEEAIHLLRRAPIETYAFFLVGIAPFVLCFFQFCSEMSYSEFAGKRLAGICRHLGTLLSLDESTSILGVPAACHGLYRGVIQPRKFRTHPQKLHSSGRNSSNWPIRQTNGCTGIDPGIPHIRSAAHASCIHHLLVLPERQHFDHWRIRRFREVLAPQRQSRTGGRIPSIPFFVFAHRHLFERLPDDWDFALLAEGAIRNRYVPQPRLSLVDFLLLFGRDWVDLLFCGRSVDQSDSGR